MGTKRSLAPLVREVIGDLGVRGSRVSDLFSGMGSVASALAPDFPVVTNDALTFTGAFARARFLNQQRGNESDLRQALLPVFLTTRKTLQEKFADRVAKERRAVRGGDSAFRKYIEKASHVGNDATLAALADTSRALTRSDDYCLTTIYFSAGYFSTIQAIDFDALRHAIDTVVSSASRDWVLSAWLSTAALLVNAPGHTAQFLKPTSEAVAVRVRRQWQRPVWETFLERLPALTPVGDRQWRSKNRVTSEDALLLVDSDLLDDVSVVYADPPYTADQYSRYYHVHETLYLYDFPASTGVGRYRDGRFHTTFSMVTTVEAAFNSMASSLSARKMPLVVSYPANGLLSEAGVNLRRLLKEHYTVRRQVEIETNHSTLGASSGSQQKAAKEKLYVCVP
jgi:adenine-specific DNA-methyltransferase